MVLWRGLLFVAAIGWPAACSWVHLQPEGEQVRVTSMEAVAQCQRVGKTTVSTLSKLMGLHRYEESMRDELNTLARNSAVELGGDAVVPIGDIEDGRQVFEVYRCQATPEN